MSKHVHAELMAEYARDAMETDKPWERWEIASMHTYEWSGCTHSINWNPCFLYRRKPKTSRERFEKWAFCRNESHPDFAWNAWQQAERQAKESG